MSGSSKKKKKKKKKKISVLNLQTKVSQRCELQTIGKFQFEIYSYFLITLISEIEKSKRITCKNLKLRFRSWSEY